MYDAVVIGAGPAGYVSAIKMAQLGLNVAVVEKEHAGGTCTNKGCIPTKALLHCAHIYHTVKDLSKKFGVNVENVSYDFKTIKKHMSRAINTSRKGVEYLLKKNGVELIKGTAVLKDAKAVTVGDKMI